jgi:acyl-CoA thioester hydrolase
MRPDPARLILGNYPINLEIATRYGDLDSLGHINNVSYARLFEEARMRFNLQARGLDEIVEFRDEARFVLVANNFSYLSESHYPHPVIVGVGATRIGTTSYALGCAMFQSGRCVAVNDATIVCADEGRSFPLPERTRQMLAKFMVAGSR